MKKRNISFIAYTFSAMILLSACTHNSTDADTNPNISESASEKILSQEEDNTHTNPATDQNVDISPDTQNDTQTEMIAGEIQTIEKMTITIDTSAVFMATGTGSYVSSGEPVEKEYATVRLTEQTIIEVHKSAGGQIIGTRVGTLEDLSLQNIVMVEGEWDDNDLVAIKIVVYEF